jgi:1,5-anhydro-D-fructose reductase (1,5-anhydro-D-mannitol-forming)
MKKLRVGLLGASWWTEIVWPGFSTASNVEIVGIASRNEEKVRAFAEAHNIPNWSTDVAHFIGSPDIDAVYVGVPNFLHEEMAIAAMAAGKHVLQEKPMALDIEKSIAQAQIAESKNLTLMVNQELRLTPCFSDLRDVITDKVGTLRKVVLSVSKAPDEWTGWRGDSTKSGGTLFEIAIHQLDLARWLFGRNPISAMATGRDEPGHDMTVILDFGHGDTAIIDYCWRTIGFTLSATCYGERGTVHQEVGALTGKGQRSITTAEGVEVVRQDGEIFGDATFRRVMEEFADAALNCRQPAIPASDGVWAVRMATAARDSMMTRETVSLSIL